MKRISITRKWPYLLVFCLLIQLFSCQPRQNIIDVKLIKEGAIKSLDSIESVKSYKLIYNPKANGVIIVTLMNDSDYSFENLNSSQLSSLLVLLNSKGIQFNTRNEEFTLQGGNHE